MPAENKTAVTLEEYIKSNYASKAKFARINNVYPQHVQKWLVAGYYVIGSTLVSPRRELK
jgi:hypothetical protein